MLKLSPSDRFLSLTLAGRFLWSASDALSNVGRLAFLGLVLSITVLVTVTSIVNGFERELKQRILALVPSVEVHLQGGLDDASQRLLQRVPGSAGAAFVRGHVMLINGDSLYGAELLGIEPAEYAGVTDLFAHTQSALPAGLGADRFTLILGAQLAEQLDVTTGDSVKLVLPIASVTAAGFVPRQRRMEVADILDSQSILDGASAYTHIDIAQRLFRRTAPDGWHIKAGDLFQLEPLIDAVYQQFPERARVRTWMSSYGNFYQAIAVQKITLFVLLLFLVAVASFNLVSGLVMIVEQRKADVAILRTVGLRGRTIVGVFVWLGMMVAISGIAIGLLLGIALAMALPVLFTGANSVFDLDLMNQYFINYLPSETRTADLIVIAVVAIGLSLLASIYPAWRAGRLLPGDVLKHE